jgi:hypothetical protein
MTSQTGVWISSASRKVVFFRHFVVQYVHHVLYIRAQLSGAVQYSIFKPHV